MLTPNRTRLGSIARHFILALALFLAIIPVARRLSPQAWVDGQTVYLTWLPLGASLAMLLLFGRRAVLPMILAFGYFYHHQFGLNATHSLLLVSCLTIPLVTVCGFASMNLGKRWRYCLMQRALGLRIICLGFVAPLLSKLLMVMVGQFVSFPESIGRYFGHGTQLFIIVDAQNMVASMMIFTYLFYYPLRLLLNLPGSIPRIRNYLSRSVTEGHLAYIGGWLLLLAITLGLLCYPTRTLLISGYLSPLLFVLFTQGALRLSPHLLLFLWAVSAWFLLRYNGNFLLGIQSGVAESFILSVLISFTVCLLYMVQIFHRSERVKRRYYDQSQTDPLTLLPNLRAFQQHLSHQRHGTLCCLRLSNLEFLSRHYGTVMRIHCIKAVAAKVGEHLQHGERVFQLPGDELLIFLKGPDAAARLRHLVTRLNKDKVSWNNTELGLQYGASWSSIRHSEIGELERTLGQLSYLAEEACVNRQVLGLDGEYAQVSDQLSERVLLLHQVREALDDEQITLYVQKIEDSAGEGYYEVLSRIYHQGELINPDKFIPLIAEFNLSKRFDMLVLRKVLQHLRHCPVPDRHPRFSVNLMPATMMQRGIALEILALFHHYQVPVSSVIIEITESQAFSDAETSITNVAILSDSGFRIAIDDFGTGYANFERLKNIRADIIKIDGCFVRDVASDRQDYMIIKSICDIAAVRGLSVVAEFVETESQRKVLRDIGVEYLQGYLIGRPGPLTAIDWSKTYRHAT